ncbi:FAD/NAD-P-binding domain-containing protein [Hymenopellis radicata]|nr:FAD/NAD-P-binding domain-containing protein [Hymenopellis radicata]
MDSPKLSVAIVGGGMCGLACAFVLSQAGYKVNVFEAGPKFEPVGAGVSLGENAVKVLRKMGILDAVLARTPPPGPMTDTRLRYLAGTEGHQVLYEIESHMSDDPMLAIYRPTFVDAVADLLDPSTVVFNKRCVSIAESGSATVIHFADGTTHEADLVIGADGVRSKVRNFVNDNAVQENMKFMNTAAFRGLIPHDLLLQAGLKTDMITRPVVFAGKDQHIVCYGIQGGRLINVVAYVVNRDIPPSPPLGSSWVTTIPEDEILGHFDGWGPDATLVMRHMVKSSQWSVHALDPPLEAFVRGRVALIGDAAHAMLPYLGAGIGQGLEDVYVLSELLKSPKIDVSKLESVLQLYSSLRSGRANTYLTRSDQLGGIYQSYVPGKEAHFASEIVKFRVPDLYDIESAVHDALQTM